MFDCKDGINYLVCDSRECEERAVAPRADDRGHRSPPEGWVRLTASTHKHPGVLDPLFHNSRQCFYCSHRCLADHVEELVDRIESSV